MHSTVFRQVRSHVYRQYVFVSKTEHRASAVRTSHSTWYSIIINYVFFGGLEYILCGLTKAYDSVD